MMKWTLPLVCVATALNVGLWLWWPREAAPRRPLNQARAEQGAARSGASASLAAVQCPVPAAAGPVREPKSSTQSTEKVVDQPWLNTVRDGVMQLSMSPKFADKVVLTKAECVGSKCQIEGSTKQGSDGRWAGSSDIASLMNTMNDGQIAGGDSGRVVALNSIMPGRDASEFSMTVEANEGPPPRNPCQSVMDRWKLLHPEDFTENHAFKAKG
jgi:hypothetical protein